MSPQSLQPFFGAAVRVRVRCWLARGLGLRQRQFLGGVLIRLSLHLFVPADDVQQDSVLAKVEVSGRVQWQGLTAQSLNETPIGAYRSDDPGPLASSQPIQSDLMAEYCEMKLIYSTYCEEIRNTFIVNNL